MGFNMLIIAALGILLNVIMIAVGALITRRKSKGEQALNRLCLPAFNIRAFCLPLCAELPSGYGKCYCLMFDVETVLCVPEVLMHSLQSIQQLPVQKKEWILNPLQKRLITSPPLVAYVVMFILAVAKY